MSQRKTIESDLLIEFKPLTEADLDQVYAIEKDVYEDPWSHQLLKDSLHASMTHCLGIFHREELIAYAIYQVIFTEGHLLNIAVKKERQHQGVGEKLLDKTMLEARNLGALYFFLEVRPSNTIARKIYEKKGFRTMITRSNYYANGEDAILMMKDLL